MKLKSALAIFLLFCGPSAQAQDGPSYEETFSFLQSKLNLIFGDCRHCSQTLVELSKCEFALVKTGVDYGYNTIYYFYARDIDPSRVTTFRGGSETGVSAGAFQNKNVFPMLVVTNRDENHHGFTHQKCKQGLLGEIMRNPNVAKLIKLEENNKFCSSLQGTGGHTEVLFRILYPQSDNAPRVQRALQHLTRLCGGREELF